MFIDNGHVMDLALELYLDDDKYHLNKIGTSALLACINKFVLILQHGNNTAFNGEIVNPQNISVVTGHHLHVQDRVLLIGDSELQYMQEVKFTGQVDVECLSGATTNILQCVFKFIEFTVSNKFSNSLVYCI